jgi:hypothetical protein
MIRGIISFLKKTGYGQSINVTRLVGSYKRRKSCDLQKWYEDEANIDKINGLRNNQERKRRSGAKSSG